MTSSSHRGYPKDTYALLHLHHLDAELHGQMASASHMLTWGNPQLHIIAQHVAEVASIYPVLWAVVGHHLQVNALP